MHLIHDIAPHVSGSIYRMVVENPKGGVGKYEVNEDLGIITLDRMLAAPVQFPFEYGIVPGTWAQSDDDPIDIMAMMSLSTFPGCLIEARVVGMYRMMDTGQVDNKILAVDPNDEAFEKMKNLNDVPSVYLRRIEFFWKNYVKLSPGKKTKGLGWSGRIAAEKYINSGVTFYGKKFKKGK